MAENKLTVFPVDNGDSMMIEHDGIVVVTDLHYRKGAQDNNNDDVYDIGKDIKDACENAHDELVCDIFILTHPDKDHLLGIKDLFHLGTSEWDPKGDLIRINELWVSPYMEDDSRSTDFSQCMFDEVTRRVKLQGKDKGLEDGNRIKILSLDGEEVSGCTGNSNNLEWFLLAPTEDEADIDATDSNGNSLSSNNSSLVIKWNALVNGKDNTFLLGGDSEVDVWERIWEDNQESRDYISWNVLVAPHHCSICTMARKNEDDEYEYSDDALDAFVIPPFLVDLKNRGFVLLQL